MRNVTVPTAIIITGPSGVGKTTAMSALVALLQDRGISCAGVDMDSLRWFHPTPEGDPFGAKVSRKHLSFLAESYHQLGIPILVVAEVIESREAMDALAEAIPQFHPQVVRLRVSMHYIDDRLGDREVPERVPWYQNRARELEQMMDAANIGDTIINVEGQEPREVARMIATIYGLLQDSDPGSESE